jgi:gas vesicle protein
MAPLSPAGATENSGRAVFPAVYSYVRKDVMGIKDKFKELSDKAKVTAGDLATKAQPHVDKAMKTATAKTNEWAEKLAETGKDVAEKTSEKTEDVADEVTETAEDVADKVTDTAEAAADKVTDTAEEVADEKE